MSTEITCVIGAGGHGRVIIDALLASGISINDIQLYDGNPSLAGSTVFDIPVECLENRSDWADLKIHVAIGDNRARRIISERMQQSGAVLNTIAHPVACISSRAFVEPGCYLAANATIGPGVVMGIGVIANHGAVVDHDCIVGNYAHIAPNATLGGNVRIGANVMIGAGAIILPQVSIGNGAIVGAGAVVVRDIAPGETCVGIPARSLRKA